MKHTLKKLVIPAKLLFLTRNIMRFALVCEENGELKICSRQNRRSNEPYPCYSVSKSTVSLALGLLYDKGFFKPEDKIADHLSELFPDNVDQKWFDVTIDHILHHKTGMQDGNGLDKISDFDDGEAVWSKRENATAIFSCPIINEPGTVFCYSDANYYILARLAEKLCGIDLMMFLAKELFGPMGFVNYSWTRDPGGHVLGGTGLMLRTEDMAKLGWLWLKKGEFDGKRFISEEWMSMGLTATVDKGNVNNYGYGVRRLSKNGYSITGARGQGMYFNVDKNYVYAWNAVGNNFVMTLCEILDKLGII